FVIEPMSNPIAVLILALGLGVLHIFVGMGLSAYRMIKQGHIKDAVFDVGFWYLIIGGLISALVLGKPGLYVAAAGAAGVLFTAGRAKKSVFGKITGGLGALYGVTGYLSDVLSYSRLMALGLTTGVVATVVNAMGSLGGNTFLGWLLFLFAFLLGHSFNIAVNILGSFVHSCRLHYVEFFGKFFEGGGHPFTPLSIKTKYVEIIKEDN
ncbi:MAG: V-type ATPase 116kDa subunit family protein, partial [Bacillota bacterium]|nr:V-type ATPase 116kDa subunit family protein [Bacillota bacterium]